MPPNLLHRIGKRDAARNKGEQHMRALCEIAKVLIHGCHM